MAKLLVADELWAVITPLLSRARPNPKGGWPPISDRSALTVLFVLTTGLRRCRRGCRQRGIVPRIARHGIERALSR